MDSDLLLDLQHLDDPSPPSFGALRAQEAAQRAAQIRSRRARVIAGAVLALVLVAGIGVAIRPDGRTAQQVQTASPPTTVAEATTVPLPTVPEIVPTTLAPAPSPTTTIPTPTTAAPAAPSPPVPGAAPTTVRPAHGAIVPTTQVPMARPGPPPAGTAPTPAGLSLILTMDAGQVPSGGTLRGIVKFRNTRSTPVTLSSSCTFWHVNLYRAGEIADGNGLDCMLYQDTVVNPGQEVVAEAQLRVEASVAPGTYDVYAVIKVETDGVRIHSQWQTLNVVRP